MTFDGVRAVLSALSEWMAVAAGTLLAAAAVFAVGAIAADALGSPVLGDTEIMEFAAAAAVAGFLPFAQMNGAHVKITVFTDWLPPSILTAIEVISRVVFAVVVTVLAWRLIVGGLDAFGRDRMTMFLRLPLWWGYLLASIPMVLWVVVTWFLALEALAGRAAGPRRFEEAGT